MGENNTRHLVHLGSADRTERSLNLRPNTEIEVAGKRIELDGREIILAKTITVNDRTTRLRDDEGNPTSSDGR